MSSDLTRYQGELLAHPALVEAILARPDVFPPWPAEPQRVLIRCDARHTDRAIARAWALAVANRELVQIELVS